VVFIEGAEHSQNETILPFLMKTLLAQMSPASQETQA